MAINKMEKGDSLSLMLLGLSHALKSLKQDVLLIKRTNFAILCHSS